MGGRRFPAGAATGRADQAVGCGRAGFPAAYPSGGAMFRGARENRAPAGVSGYSRTA